MFFVAITNISHRDFDYDNEAAVPIGMTAACTALNGLQLKEIIQIYDIHYADDAVFV